MTTIAIAITTTTTTTTAVNTAANTGSIETRLVHRVHRTDGKFDAPHRLDHAPA